MGQMDYVVITDNTAKALDELNQFFRNDPKFKIKNLDKLCKYKDKTESIQK